jgi:hypothetical protein
MVRLSGSANEIATLTDALAPHVHVVSITGAEALLRGAWSDAEWISFLRQMPRITRPLLLCVPADMSVDSIDRIVRPALDDHFAGVLVDGVISDGPALLRGSPAHAPAVQLVTALRQRWPQTAIVASGGVHDPCDALRLFEAGADLVQIDSGLVYSGPGLPKRVNEAILCQRLHEQRHAPPQPFVQASWFWTLLMAASMFFGGIMALIIACTRVVLPYDEALVGLRRHQFAQINERLLAFMAHDRATLAGTMISLGVLYGGLSLFGIRRGLHWARIAVLSSAFAGFFTFFLFLGFGYFDPFHAFVTTILFQFLLLAVFSVLPMSMDPTPANLREDWAWRLSQWGQLLLIIHGGMLLVAGATISFIGSTTVFVPEDLHFMQTSAEHLRSAADGRLVPLVAHDRATFGGMLLAIGITVLLSSLWGFKQGYAWLWWSLAISGTVAYVTTIAIHLGVGYTDFGHLIPAYAGLAMLWLALGLSYGYLCRRAEA